MLGLVQAQGGKLLAGRHENAKKLRLLGENIGLLSESQASDLRSDIKHFLSERKIDEELAKMEWFSGSVDELKQEVQHLGKGNVQCSRYRSKALGLSVCLSVYVSVSVSVFLSADRLFL
jgi:hypothetical protein